MNEKYPRHDRKSFFKYATASTVITILESAKVKYSSPLLFNDPFEIQSGLHFDFDINSLPERLLDRIEGLVTSSNDPQFLDPNDFSKTIIYMRGMRDEVGFPRNRARQLFLPLLEILKVSASEAQQGYQNHWWSNFLPRMRVFSVTESNDNLLMWSHYANDHKGAVLEFRVLPEQDNPLCVAGPVRYVQDPPPFFTEQEWIDSTLGLIKLNPTKLYYQYAYAKSDIWAYEKEWRVWDLPNTTDEGLHAFYDLKEDEIAAIYLGCRISPEDRRVVEQLRAKLNPKAALYQAQKSLEEFKVTFLPC